jgi:RNA polymerase sigma-70 factor, ECF subfamily
MDDVEAIRRLKAGDIGGLEALVVRYQVKAARAAYFITHDEAAAEDIAQETFLRLFKRIAAFDDTRPFEPYLMRSVVYAALDHTNRQNHTISLEGSIAQVERLLGQAALPVETQVEDAQLKHALLSALSQLSPRQRAAVVGRYYLELSEQEMAQLLDAPRGTVKWLLNAARSRLRGLLVSERGLE